MRRAPRPTLERHAIAVGAVLLATYDVVLTMLPAPLAGVGQIRHVVPRDAVNGSRFVLLVLGMLLFQSAPGLWHGKRFAWAMALACCAGSAFAHPFKHLDLWGTSASMLLAGVLIGARAQFPARSDPPTALRGVLTLVVGLAAVFVYSTAGLYLLDPDFRHPVPLGSALRDSFTLLFIVPAATAEPATHHGVWFIDSVRAGVLLVLALGLAQLLRPVIDRTRIHPAERGRVRKLLERYGDSSIAFFALLPDKTYFFAERGDAVLAFKAVGGNAVVMGDPIGDEAALSNLVESFQEHCELNGWAVAFHQATPRYLEEYRRHRLAALKIGEEGTVRVQEFSLAGHAMKQLRSRMNHFEREGFQAEVLAPPHSPALIVALREISDEWLARGGHRERTFTLGYFDEALLQTCEIMVARTPGGSPVGFANIIPSYRSRTANFDMVRYRREPGGVADFLYVSLIRHFRRLGYAGMNLGLAPFSGITKGGVSSPAERAMRLLYERGDFLFRYKGLREFKEKFAPAWEPRYLVYGSDLQLPGIALAVARAGELGGRGRHGAPLATLIARVRGMG